MRKGAHAYYGKDGRCGWFNTTTKKYEQPKLKYPNAFKPADEDNNEYKMEEKRFCLFQFHQVAMQPLCGDEWYSQIKYCAMVDFYKNQNPYQVKIGDPPSDVVLLMIDGCVLCTSDSHPTNDSEITIRLKHAWKPGSKFTSCDETKNVAGELVLNLTQQTFYDVLVSTQDPSSSLIEDVGNAIKYQAYLNAYSSSFSIAAVLYHRVCKGIFTRDPEEDYFREIELEVTHNCGVNKKLFIPLKDIVPSKFKNNMAELRGLMLLLSNSEWMQYRIDGFKFETPEGLPNGKPVYDNVAKNADD
uniref:Uncharacterized protein n=1 Tax=Meloidogyne enterolobii TaxID=390850 RepID=A0A6V7TW75_MELEN|nr:unnamed protein product [Meloidogyne enterolobii]